MIPAAMFEAVGSDGAPLYAAADDSARYVTGAVAPMKLGALLAPFATVEAAQAALVAACGTIRTPDKPKGKRA
jgi:hypothetical protein